jgi:hypothetical protein
MMWKWKLIKCARSDELAEDDVIILHRILRDVEKLAENIQDFGFGEMYAGIKMKFFYLLCAYFVIFLMQKPNSGWGQISFEFYTSRIIRYTHAQ